MTHPAHEVATYQGGHSKADDLNTAVIMPLRFEVSVVACVTPGHGPCTVPVEVCRGNLMVGVFVL